MPGAERYAATGAGTCPVARDVVASIHLQTFCSSSDHDPVSNFRVSRIQLGNWKRSQSVKVAGVDGGEDPGIQFFVDRKMAHATRGDHLDPHRGCLALNRRGDCFA